MRIQRVSGGAQDAMQLGKGEQGQNNEDETEVEEYR